jgi:hypothetical protein
LWLLELLPRADAVTAKEPLLEGPLRFAPERPEYQSFSVELPAGDHMLAFHAHHLGVETRLLKDMKPFLWCEVLAVPVTSSVPVPCLVMPPVPLRVPNSVVIIPGSTV